MSRGRVEMFGGFKTVDSQDYLAAVAELRSDARPRSPKSDNGGVVDGANGARARAMGAGGRSRDGAARDGAAAAGTLFEV